MHRLDTFPNNEMIEKYRHVFSTREADEVLAHMMFELGAFLEVSDRVEDVALKNYGTRLLSILGGGEVATNTLSTFIKRLIKQPLKEGKET